MVCLRLSANIASLDLSLAKYSLQVNRQVFDDRPLMAKDDSQQRYNPKLYYSQRFVALIWKSIQFSGLLIEHIFGTIFGSINKINSIWSQDWLLVALFESISFRPLISIYI